MNAQTTQNIPGNTPVIALARSETTSSAQLAAMLDSPNAVVAINIANRSDLDEPIIKRLAADKRAAVRLRVAKNPNTPVEILQELQLDSAESVSNAAAETLAKVMVAGSNK